MVQRIFRKGRQTMRNVLALRRTIGPALPPASHPLRDFQEFCTEQPQRRALVSYLVAPLRPPLNKRDRVMFSNQGIAQEIPRALNELGYAVDVVQYDFVNWRRSACYDLFIGHGGANFEEISRQLSPDAIQIYFSTGIYWREWNVREARRLYELGLRRGYLLRPDRAIVHSEEYANRVADGIICLGNDEAVRTYNQFPLVIGVTNAAYPVELSELANKNHEAGRNHFLFFSGSGNIHKGLDLLLEAFAETNLDLHICQHIDDEFARVYRRELAECPNIHVHGHVAMRSSEFEALATACNWTVSATCAEGQPGAILECMAYGMIPIVPSAANIDLGDFGLLLPDRDVESIRETLITASRMPREECRRRDLATRAVIEQEYTPERFRSGFKSAVQLIVNAARQKGGYPKGQEHAASPSESRPCGGTGVHPGA